MRIIIRSKRRGQQWLRWIVLTAVLECVLAGTLTWSLRGRPAENRGPVVAQARPADLTVSSVGFVGMGEQRSIAGVLNNRSGTAYADVTLTFSLIGADGDTVGSIDATVDRVRGHETSKFEASGVDPAAVEIVLQHMEARPPLAGP